MNRIRTLREAQGMKQIELANLCNVNQSTLSGWETGRHNPGNTILVKLSEIFNVSAGYILGFEDDKGSMNIEIINQDIYKSSMLSDMEKKLIKRFRSLDEEDQEAVLYRALELIKQKREDVEARNASPKIG